MGRWLFCALAVLLGGAACWEGPAIAWDAGVKIICVKGHVTIMLNLRAA